MNRTTTAPNDHRTDTVDYQRGRRPSWLPLALIAGAIALGIAAYAAFDGSRERGNVVYDETTPGVGESGQRIERGSLRGGNG
jgi:hypothetical protein